MSSTVARVSRVMRWSWPRGFPLVQFPNPPLAAALLASITAQVTRGGVHRALIALFYSALSVWAYEEARHGVNWFRRLLGLGFAVYVVLSLAGALRRT
jgi:hypothetical protein